VRPSGGKPRPKHSMNYSATRSNQQLLHRSLETKSAPRASSQHSALAMPGGRRWCTGSCNANLLANRPGMGTSRAGIRYPKCGQVRFALVITDGHRGVSCRCERHECTATTSRCGSRRYRRRAGRGAHQSGGSRYVPQRLSANRGLFLGRALHCRFRRRQGMRSRAGSPRSALTFRAPPAQPRAIWS
jgi:hypothetical protein